MIAELDVPAPESFAWFGVNITLPRRR